MEKSEVFKRWKEHLSQIKHHKKWDLIQESDMSLGDYPEFESRRYTLRCTGIGRKYGYDITFPIRLTIQSKEIIYCDSDDVAGAEQYCKEWTNTPWEKYCAEQFAKDEGYIESRLKLQAYYALSEEANMYGAWLYDWRLDEYSEPDVRCRLKSCYAPIYVETEKGKTVIGYLQENGKIKFDSEITQRKSNYLAITLGIILSLMIICLIYYVCRYWN